MKKLPLILFISLLPLGLIVMATISSEPTEDAASSATAEKEDCGCSPKKNSKEADDASEQIVNKEMRDLALDLCLSIEVSTSRGEDHIEGIVSVIRDHIKRKTGENPTDEDISRLWYENTQHFICRHEYTYAYEYPQHISKRLIDMSMTQSVLFKLIRRIGKEEFNINVIETLEDGTLETILDYVDRIIATPERHHKYNMSVIHAARDAFVRHLGAKKASELTQE